MSSHPVNDFLTPDVIDFLQELEQGTISQPMTILNGTMATGKSVFIKLLKYVKNTIDFYIGDIINSTTISSIKKEIRANSKRPDMIFLWHDEYGNDLLESLTKIGILDELKTIGIPLVMIISDIIPERYIAQYGSKVKLLHFNNYYTLDITDDLAKVLSRTHDVTPKLLLVEDDIINDDGVKIIRNAMIRNKNEIISKKRRRETTINHLKVSTKKKSEKRIRKY